MIYGAEIWDLSKSNTGKLMATEVDLLRRTCRRFSLERVRNQIIRRDMNIEKDITDEVER